MSSTTKTSNSQSPRQFQGMGYRELQRLNSERRGKLPPGDRARLKQNGYKNVGWNQVIRLHLKIDELLGSDNDEDSLEDLFLKADRIGNQYQTSEEIETFQQQLAHEAQAVSDLVDEQFPVPSKVEFVDFSQPRSRHTKRRCK